MPRQSCKTSDNGAVLIFTAFLLFVFLALVGLAIDSGNLYRAQLALQGAADAAALDGVNYTIKLGNRDLSNYAAAATGRDNDEGIEQFLQGKCEATVRANLADAGYPLTSEDEVPVCTYSPSTDQSIGSGVVFDYEVTAKRLIHFLIMDKVPFIGAKERQLTAKAKAQRNVANIALILDVSHSMACPASGACDCLDAGTCPTSGSRRIDVLAKAVKDFLLMFDNKDNILIVPFNIAAASPLNWQEEREKYGFDPDTATETEIQAFINQLFERWEPRSNTNICDAFMEAYAGMDKLAHDAQAAYVFFSDGAPTAGRFLFSPAAVEKKRLEQWTYPDGGGNYDYVHYSLHWKDSKTGSLLTGPSVLVQKGMLGFDWREAQPPAVGTYHAAADRASIPSDKNKGCGPDDPSVVASASGTNKAAADVFSPCLNNLEAHHPHEPSKTYGSEYQDTAGFGRWPEQYYNCAIELSDYIRLKKGTFYVIGSGEPETSPADPSDPYQNAADTTYRKDYFLARVANDPDAAVPASRPWPSPPPAPLSFAYDSVKKRGYSAYKGYNDAYLSKMEHRGKYLATSSMDDLRLLFQQIARKIKLKLVA